MSLRAVSPWLAIPLALLSLAFSPARQTPQAPSVKPQPPRIASHVIVVSISGFGADDGARPGDGRLRLPRLSALRGRGIYAVGVESVYPSLMNPAHTSIATGVPPADHGVTGDYPFDEQSGAASDEPYWLAHQIKSETLWEAARRGGLTTAAVGYPVTAGAPITLNLPPVPAESHVRDHVSPPGLLAEISAALQADAAAIVSPAADPVSAEKQDRLRAAAAAYLIEKHRPHLLMISLGAVAAAQRAHGPQSEQARAALEQADALLGQISDAVERSAAAGETALWVVSDHGSMRSETEFRPNVVLAKKGLLTVNGEGRITAWRAVARATGGAAAVFIKDPQDVKTAEEVEKLWREVHERPESPVWRVVTRRDAVRVGADPRATLFLDAAPGYVFSSRATGSTTGRAPARAAAGYLPQRSEMRAALVAAGRGLKTGAKIEHARLIDLAPTVARLLGLELRAARGRVISEVIEP
ncbi:MAG TPA: ectonucleotide pyrophosphatase/phosphodiesterase [Blastocatellia bacterium]|nr:ectonucleotide pyrophosphatase/phosphodiesterase [Blastocatellia bacterium]